MPDRMPFKARENLKSGDRFNNVVFTGEYVYVESSLRWLCEYLCDCGKKFICRHDVIVKGKKKTCGCGSGNRDWVQKKKNKGDIYPFYIILSRVKKQAKIRNIEVLITEEDIKSLWEKQDGKCYYTGLNLNLPNSFPEHDSDNKSVSIDRINSDLPYGPDNIQIVMKIVNYMKLQMSSKEFIERCKQVYSYKGA